MRTESGNSLALERSMNLQCHIMTFEEALRNASVIDKLDDERREKMFGLIKWKFDMNIHFDNRLSKILDLDNLDQIKKELLTLQNDIKKFNEKFEKSFESVKKDELYYENIDDELRTYLINYAVKCREQLRIENSEVEEKLIRENKENLKK
ncbi:hypothetical protein VSU16_05265 [Cetobacterium somerae]|uniref:hypothetical protein n=1 Tax=Cetobacterium somerae TaxID=188913 RepID=UPI002E7BEA72|nr:hypothetical protein [Cetobacterium somerae]WVJ02155.1 hypothetical protein VSU16_05265 [Cetobacterium somerae]